jgi:SAP domain-containing ribonucleoprotein
LHTTYHVHTCSRKALKVAELKDILAKANEKPAAKATKADLIARILASPAALDAFAKENGGAGASAEEEVRARRVYPDYLTGTY